MCGVNFICMYDGEMNVIIRSFGLNKIWSVLIVNVSVGKDEWYYVILIWNFIGEVYFYINGIR